MKSANVRTWSNCCNVNDLSLCCVPKAASTSQKAALLLSLGVQVRNIHGNAALRRTAPQDSTGRTAAFVRNPWTRLVGTWQHRLHGRVTNVTRGFIKRGFRVGMPFDAFLRRLPEVYLDDCHTAPQSLFVPHDVQFLHTVEDIRHGWSVLQTDHDWLHDLPDYGSRYYEPEMPLTTRGWRILETLYADDLHLWNTARENS